MKYKKKKMKVFKILAFKSNINYKNSSQPLFIKIVMSRHVISLFFFFNFLF